MNLSTSPFTQNELNQASLSGEGLSELATQVFETMKGYPKLLKLSLFTLQCIDLQGQQRKGPSSPPRMPGSPTLSDVTMVSNFSSASGGTAVSVYDPDEYEKMSYYNGITGDGDHPDLIYRSDLFITPFPKPIGRHASLPVKSLRGVFDTPLNDVWDAVGPQIRDLIKARKIDWSSVDPARFFTHAPLGEDVKGSLGPVVIWIGVAPGSTSADTAHEVSQEILALLRKNGVDGVVVEWHEAVPQRLAGPPPPLCPMSTAAMPLIMSVAPSLPFLALPLQLKKWRSRIPRALLCFGSMRTKTRTANPATRFMGQCAHALHSSVRNASIPARPRDEITMAIANHGILADLWARDMVRLQARLGVENRVIMGTLSIS